MPTFKTNVHKLKNKKIKKVKLHANSKNKKSKILTVIKWLFIL